VTALTSAWHQFVVKLASLVARASALNLVKDEALLALDVTFSRGALFAFTSSLIKLLSTWALDILRAAEARTLIFQKNLILLALLHAMAVAITSWVTIEVTIVAGWEEIANTFWSLVFLTISFIINIGAIVALM